MYGLPVPDRKTEMENEPNHGLIAGPLPFGNWLKRRRAVAIGMNIFSAVAYMAAGVTILAVIFWFTYAVVWFGYNYGISAVSELLFGRNQHISHNAILIICWCFLALLFVEYGRVSRGYWSDYPVTQSSWSNLWLAGVIGSLVALLVNYEGSSRLIGDLLLTGPRLLGSGIRALHRAFLLTGADLQMLSDALAILTGRTSPISADELSSRLQCRHSSGILFQLAALDIVLLIREEPPAIVLDPDLRDQLRTSLRGDSEPEVENNAESEPVTASANDFATYELFGLTPSASLEELKAAFQKKIKECHPDIFAGRSDDAYGTAEEKARALIDAYKTLLAQYRHKTKENKEEDLVP